jgi:hypothetical protein
VQFSVSLAVLVVQAAKSYSRASRGGKVIRKLMAVLTLVLLTQGCASSGTADGEVGGRSQATMSRTNVISEQELAEYPEFSSVAEAVRRLRPRWREEAVYINDGEYVGSTRDIAMFQVKELRYLELSEAQMRWGQSVSTSVIQIITK